MNNIKKYMTLGAVLAASGFMVSCDDDNSGDDVTLVTQTGVADAINNAIGDKAVAPIALAEFPFTSLKLTFDNAAGACLGAAFNAGEELEIDFDSTTVTDAADTTADGQADLDFPAAGGANNVVFGVATDEGFVQGIVADPSASSWTIENVYNGTDETGNLLLSELRLTPLASDQRTVSGRFTASAPVDVAINQDNANVIIDVPVAAAGLQIALPGGAGNAPVNSITVYDDNGGFAEVESLNAALTFESRIGQGNVAVSLSIGDPQDGCVVNFVMSLADFNAAVPNADFNAGVIPIGEQPLLTAVLDLESTLDVSPVGSDEITTNIAAPRYLIAGTTDGGVTGSYRHDYDSSIGTIETAVNSEND